MYFLLVLLDFLGSGAWICQLGAWICQFGAWICLLSAWICLLGAWICLLGARICLLGAWICLLGAWICLLGAWNCLLGHEAAEPCFLYVFRVRAVCVFRSWPIRGLVGSLRWQPTGWRLSALCRNASKQPHTLEVHLL